MPRIQRSILNLPRPSHHMPPMYRSDLITYILLFAHS